MTALPATPPPPPAVVCVSVWVRRPPSMRGRLLENIAIDTSDAIWYLTALTPALRWCACIYACVCVRVRAYACVRVCVCVSVWVRHDRRAQYGQTWLRDVDRPVCECWTVVPIRVTPSGGRNYISTTLGLSPILTTHYPLWFIVGVVSFF